MNRSQFQQLMQYAGGNFLNFILNFDQITKNSNYDELVFNSYQTQVLDNLYKKIQQFRLLFIAQGSNGDRVDIFLNQINVNGISLFNHYRQICGGQLELPTTADPLVSYLQQVCIRDYPHFLMKSSRVPYHTSSVGLNFKISSGDEFIDLVKDDILNQITNKADGDEYRFQFATDDGLEFSTQVSIACSTLIMRSFYDSCNRMDFSLPRVLNAIEMNIDMLRKLAKGQQVTYSSFIGIRGVQFRGFDEIEFPDALLRRFRDNSNPCMHTDRTVVIHNGDYTGHVFEIFHTTKITNSNGATNTIYSSEIHKEQEIKLQKLLFAIVFSSLANRGPVPTFYEVGFPMVEPGNFVYGESFLYDNIEIYGKTKEKLVDWYRVLRDKDLKKVDTPLKRLQFAIFERRNPEDSIVDAIIAWEGMFSAKFETAFKVTGSMAKFLRSGQEQEKIYKRLKKLYGLRSVLVHGGESNLLKTESIDDVRAEVIEIGLECVMKIIKDDRLLSMTSEERIEDILVFDQACGISAQNVNLSENKT